MKAIFKWSFVALLFLLLWSFYPSVARVGGVRKPETVEQWMQDLDNPQAAASANMRKGRFHGADPVEDVQLEAICWLNFHGEKAAEALPSLQKCLSPGNSRIVRGEALRAIVTIQDKVLKEKQPVRTGDEWVKLLKSDSEVLNATHALQKLASVASIPALIPLLSHKDLSVRYFACNAIDRSIARAADAIRASKIDNRTEKIEAQRNEIAKILLGPILDMANSDNNYLVEAALETFGNLGSYYHVEAMKPAVPVMAKLLSSEDGSIRAHTALILERIGKDAAGAIPALICCAQEEQRRSSDPQHPLPTRYNPKATLRFCIGALGQMGPEAKEAAPMIIQALSDPDPNIKRWATLALMQIGGGRGAVEILIRNLEDENPSVRSRSARVLGKEVEAAASSVPALTKALSDPIKGVRFSAACSLRDLAPYAQSSLPALRKCLDHPDDFVRHAAKEAIERIEASMAKTKSSQK